MLDQLLPTINSINSIEYYQEILLSKEDIYLLKDLAMRVAELSDTTRRRGKEISLVPT